MPDSFPFDEERAERTGHIFPDIIEEDEWILYHGSSSAAETAIEASGLRWTPRLYTKDDIQGLCNVFRELRWAGFSQGGYPILAPFSLGHDFADRDQKPIFLAETSYRAALYASEEWAGGETARAARLALSDLYLLANDSNNTVQTGAGCFSWHDKNQDVDWLRSRLAELEDLRVRLNDVVVQHKYGVIYAVRIGRARLSRLTRSQMGIMSKDRIPASAIVGKVRIPRIYRTNAFHPAADWLDRPVARGVMQAIRLNC